MKSRKQERPETGDGRTEGKAGSRIWDNDLKRSEIFPVFRLSILKL